ncbi:SLATT domain-containing protein [Haloactinopolyspora alba]|nr:SLATT domain-containing protein [Haloactinopolyspora alba]
MPGILTERASFVIAHPGWHAPVSPGGSASLMANKWSDMTNAVESMPDPARYLLAQVRESFGRVVYSHKTHEKQADFCFTKYRWQQVALVGLTAISSGTFLASVVGVVASPKIGSLVTSLIALLVTAISLATKTFKFADEADAHRATAAHLWDVRESYLSLIADLMAGRIAESDARARRDELQEAARSAYSEAPRTTAKAFSKASDGLKNNEEMTFTSREIDMFLPEALRLNESEA